MRKLLSLLAFLPLPLLAVEPLRIQDNSFLIEEAYNQDPRVVQHIFSMTRSRDGQWSGTFTQEWPVGGIKNQLSYTIPFTRVTDSPDGKTGVGDIALNYRYQLLGDGEAKLAAVRS